jgi:triosephosphate isomerase
MRKPFIAANWKLNKTVPETLAFLDGFIPLVKNVNDVDIVVAPPFTSLYAASSTAKGSNVKLAAQDVFYEDKGAYTGEVSPAMLADVGCEYVIIGHSERRQYFQETDETLNKKIKASRAHNLKVIFCIGESLDEREAGHTFDVLKREITEGLKDIPSEGLIVAYEPIWAIGTGRTATPEQAQETHKFIRGLLATLYGGASEELRILYGGSMTPDNVATLMACPDVDGGLVGGASLKAESFAVIVKLGKT